MKIHLHVLMFSSLFTVLGVMAQGQISSQALQEAFDNSYKLEWKGSNTEALSTLKEVYSEDSYEINLRLGWLCYLAGSFTEAAAFYQKAITLKPYAIEAKFGSILPSTALGNWDQVITRYNEILEISPQNTQALYRLGMVYYGKNEYQKAEGYFEKVVNLFPFDYDSNIMYAWTFLKLGKYREAQVVFNKVLLIKPNDPSALEGLGLIK